MARVALLMALLTSTALMPEACGRLFGTAAPPEPPPPPSSVVPVTSATTPPVWVPPELASAPPPTFSPAAAISPDLAKARAAAQAGDHKKVRSLLEKRVRTGKASREEAVLVADACIALRDKACVDAVKAKHPEIDAPER